MKSRNTFDYIKLFFNGIFMGIADAIPGVSGGTIALLLGIYEELIDTISRLNFSLITDLKKNGLKSFWNKLNGNFLITLVLGIGIGLISFIIILERLLTDYPLYISSFFLGLIISTIYIIYKLIKSWNFINIFSVLLMIIFSVIIPSEPVNTTENINLLYVLICGVIASSAMILPGISGSLILVILGVYIFLISALKNFMLGLTIGSIHEIWPEILIILTFILGAIIGLLGFSRVLKYLFKNYRNITYSIMLGLIIGSIHEIWPWKKDLIPKITDFDIVISTILVLCGFSLILILEKINKQ